MNGKTVIFCFLLLKLEFSLSFQCPGYEIPLKHKCDGINNCGDNSDEKDCPFIGKIWISFKNIVEIVR